MDEILVEAEITPSTSTRSISLQLDQHCMDVLEYIGGRVVQKFSKKYSELEGEPDSKFKWISLKNCGGLKYPSDSLMRGIQEMEKSFRLFHGEKIDLQRKPIERLVDIILEKTSFAKEVVQFFVKIRFFHRIKVLNTKPRNERKGVRDLKQLAQFTN